MTKITDSFKCLIRKKWVASTPEEGVRQSFLQRMLALGYPKGLIAVEKKIGERRFDIVCYTPEMRPVLLVECKAGSIDAEAERQAIGYNEKVGAPFLCLVGCDGVKTMWSEKGKWKSVPFLPEYSQIYAIAQRV